MESKLKRDIAMLIGEAHEAADPSTGGLLGRRDLEELVSRLSAAAETLLSAQEELEEERNLLLTRLNGAIPEESVTHPSFVF